MTTKGVYFGIGTALFFGLSIVANKIGLEHTEITPLIYTTITSCIAAILSALFLLTKAQALRKTPPRSIVHTAAIGVIAAIGYIFLFEGQERTSAINTGLLTALTSFFAIPFAIAFLGEHLHKKQWPFVVLLFAGVYVLIVGNHLLEFNIGDILIIGTAIAWGLTGVLTKFPLRAMEPSIFACLRMIFGMLFLIIVTFPFFIGTMGTIETLPKWYLLSGVLMFGAIFFLVKTISEAKAVIALLVAVAYPIVTSIASALFLGEELTVQKIIGGALILVSIYQIVRIARQTSTSVPTTSQSSHI